MLLHKHQLNFNVHTVFPMSDITIEYLPVKKEDDNSISVRNLVAQGYSTQHMKPAISTIIDIHTPTFDAYTPLLLHTHPF